GVALRRDAPLDAAHVRIGRGFVLRAREEQRHVDRHAGEDRFLDRLRPGRRAGNLDEEVVARGLRVELRDRRRGRRGVVGEERRHLERHPAVEAAAGAVDRREQRRRIAQILDRQREEQRLVVALTGRRAGDRVVVIAAAGDRMVEDRRVRREPGDRVLVDVARQRAVLQQPARDVVEPQPLAELVQLAGGIHGVPPSSVGLCQPSGSATTRAASRGPHVPGAYTPGGGMPASTGSTTRHAASMLSLLAKSDASPSSASPISFSYGVIWSGDWRRAISSTSSPTMRSPGALTRACSEMNTSGERRKRKRFPDPAFTGSNTVSGGRLRSTTTSVEVTGSFLPARM